MTSNFSGMGSSGVIEINSPIVKKGQKIMCGNDHPIAIANRDVYKGDTNYYNAFDFTFETNPPGKGTLPEYCLCGVCGGMFWNGNEAAFIK